MIAHEIDHGTHPWHIYHNIRTHIDDPLDEAII